MSDTLKAVSTSALVDTSVARTEVTRWDAGVILGMKQLQDLCLILFMMRCEDIKFTVN